MKTEGHIGRPWEELLEFTNKKSSKQRATGSVLSSEQTCKWPACLSHSQANLLITGPTAAQGCTCSCFDCPTAGSAGLKKQNRSGHTAAIQHSSPALFLSSYLQTLSTSSNKSTKKKKEIKLVIKIPACSVLYQSVTQQRIFIGDLTHNGPFSLPPFASQDFRIEVAGKCKAPSHSTPAPLPTSSVELGLSH